MVVSVIVGALGTIPKILAKRQNKQEIKMTVRKLRRILEK